MKNCGLYLVPMDGRKSFYNKAVLLDMGGGVKALRSYETIVAMVLPGGRFVRTWGGYSATTMRHVNAFRAACGLDCINKKSWDDMAIEEA